MTKFINIANFSVYMKVLLINPPATNTFEEHDEPNHPCMSIAYIAAYLRLKNIDVDVVDSKLERLSFKETIERFKRYNYDVVGFTSFTLSPSSFIFWASI